MNSLKADIVDFIRRNFQISDEDTSYQLFKDKISGKFYKNLHRVLQTEDLDCEENIIIKGDF